MNVADSTKMTSGGASRTRQARDARSARAARTRAAIADALAELVREGTESPSAADVARRAGVGVRTVYHHFGDMESLYSEIVRRYETRVANVLTRLDPLSDVETRVSELVAQRCAIYELLAPLRRAVHAGGRARSSPAIRAARHRLEYALARHASETFAPELRGRPDRHGVLERVAAHTSYEVWDHLVRLQHLPAARARRHMALTVLREFSDLLA